MPTLSGISSFATGGGNGDMSVDITNNNLILNQLSFKNLGCDELLGDVAKVGVQTTFDPKSLADAEPYWNVGKEFARCRKVVDLFDTGFNTFSYPPVSITGVSPGPYTLRIDGMGLFVPGNVTLGNLTATLVSSSQPNITQVGVLDSLNVNGTIRSESELSAPYVFGGACVISGNTLLGVTTTAALTASSVTTGGAVTAGGLLTAGGVTLNGRLLANNNTLRLGTSATDDWDTLRLSGRGGTTTNFAGVSTLDGVVLYGKSGGMLGGNSLGTSISERCALRWYASGANAAVGINTTGPVTGALDVNGDAYVRGRLFTNGVAAAGTLMPQGSHMAWNFVVGQGETDFINKSGSGAGGFHFYNSTGDGTAFSVNTNLIATLTPAEGLVVPSNYIRGRQIFCRVDTSAASSFTVPATTTPIFASGAGGTTVVHDLRPSTMAVGGVTNGAYRLPVAGIYQITVNARFNDGAGGTKGILIKKWNGSVATNVLRGDGVHWCPDDGAGRRCISVTATAQFAGLEEVYPTVFSAGQVMEHCTMTVTHVSIP